MDSTIVSFCLARVMLPPETKVRFTIEVKLINLTI